MAAVLQQRIWVSDTTTGRGRKKNCPRSRDSSIISSSSREKFDGRSIMDREAAWEETNGNLQSGQNSDRCTTSGPTVETAAVHRSGSSSSRARVDGKSTV